MKQNFLYKFVVKKQFNLQAMSEDDAYDRLMEMLNQNEHADMFEIDLVESSEED